ncbi:MAG: PAS domain S-box protein [Candidatus Korobacteraceae bacterium]
MSYQIKRALRIALLAMVSALVFQITIHIVNAHISLWESHALTIGFITVLTFVVSLMVLRREARAEDSLSEGEQLLQSVLQSGLDGFYLVDTYGKLLDVNDAYCVMSGYTREELLRMSVADVEASETEEDVAEHIQRVIQKGVDRFESCHRRKDGRIFNIETCVNFQNFNGGRLFCFLRDITERTRSEQSLRESEERFRQLLELAPLPLAFVTEEGVISFRNQRFVSVFGYTAEDVPTISEWWPRAYPDPEYRQWALGRWNTVIRASNADGRDIQPTEANITCKNGEVRIIEVSGITLGDRVLATFIDITERKRMEETLRRSEERFRLVTHATNDAIWDLNIGSGKAWRSENFWEQFGYPPKATETDLAGWKDLLHPEDRDRVWNSFQTALLRRSHSHEIEYRFRRADGTYAVVLDRAFVVYDETGKPTRAIGAVTDLSNHRLLEEQLRQAAKMEAVGHLAGAVAHDFNNLLMGISMQTELLMKTPDPRQAEERAGTILSAIESAGKLTKKLLAFSRKQELAISTFDLNQLLDETNEFIGRLLPKSISVDARLSASPCWVDADRVQMEQIIINLVINARDAMPEGGKLVLSDCHIEINADDLGLHGGVPSGAYGLISVADTGHGIPEQHLEKIFEPFFTTKQKEHGTGLGLSIVYGIVIQSGGHIRVKSAVGAGTTFTIYIPSVERPQAEPPKLNPCPLEISEASCPREGTVLVVDDEAIVRRSVRAYLELNGLTVLDCADASEALKVASELKDGLALLITDVVMPDMTGIDLARALVKQLPELPIIFMSGYTSGEKGHEEFRQAKFLQKPFACATLLDTVCKGLQICPRQGKVPNLLEP